MQLLALGVRQSFKKREPWPRLHLDFQSIATKAKTYSSFRFPITWAFGHSTDFNYITLHRSSRLFWAMCRALGNRHKHHQAATKTPVLHHARTALA